MNDSHSDLRALLEALEVERTLLHSAKIEAGAKFAALGLALRAVEDHPNRAAYGNGGIFAAKDFGAEHVLPLIGFAALPWPSAIARIGTMSVDQNDCVLSVIRKVCEQEAALEQSGLGWLGEALLLRNGKVPPFWFKRPKLGLGQTAKFYGLKHDDAAAHRGVYALGIETMSQVFGLASTGGSELSFGALLPVVIARGGRRLQQIGADALHADAEARYWARKRSFAEHEAVTPGRQWRDKPPLSRQGHLAVTTAQKLGIQVPAVRTRGDAADWLEAHNANLRFRGDAK